MEQKANAQRQQTVRIDINYLVINQQINKDNFPKLDDIPIEPAPLKKTLTPYGRSENLKYLKPVKNITFQIKLDTGA